jgi:hypothetical protein
MNDPKAIQAVRKSKSDSSEMTPRQRAVELERRIATTFTESGIVDPSRFRPGDPSHAESIAIADTCGDKSILRRWMVIQSYGKPNRMEIVRAILDDGRRILETERGIPPLNSVDDLPSDLWKDIGPDVKRTPHLWMAKWYCDRAAALLFKRRITLADLLKIPEIQEFWERGYLKHPDCKDQPENARRANLLWIAEMEKAEALLVLGVLTRAIDDLSTSKIAELKAQTLHVASQPRTGRPVERWGKEKSAYLEYLKTRKRDVGPSGAIQAFIKAHPDLEPRDPEERTKLVHVLRKKHRKSWEMSRGEAKAPKKARRDISPKRPCQ